MRRIYLLVLFVVLSCASLAQSVRIQLEDCRLSNDEYDELRRAVWFQQNFYMKAFGDSLDKQFSAKVLADKKAYMNYSKSIMDYRPRHSIAAYFDPELNQIVIHKELYDFVGTFKHEISHGLANMYCTDMDDWLHEGLAELFEDVSFTSKEEYQFDSYPYNYKHRQIIDLLSKEISLEDLFVGEFYDVKFSYLMSWSIVNYLYLTDKDLLYEIVRGSCSPAGRVIDRNYPGGLRMLEADMRAYYFNLE